MLPENRELRADARQALNGKWGQMVLVALIYLAVTGIWSAPGGMKAEKEHFDFAADVLFPFIGFLISGPMAYGIIHYFLKFIRNEEEELSDLFQGFRQFWKTVALYLLVCVFTVLWSLLFVVPGIIAAIRYSQSFFILRDNPELSPMEAIAKSKLMMDGYKSRYFCLGMSFIGWALLACMTLGIGFLWLMPYMMTAFSMFYDKRKNMAETEV